MKNRSITLKRSLSAFSLFVLLSGCANPVTAQDPVPVDEDGNPLASTNSLLLENAPVSEELPIFTAAELQEVVGPIALYPDNLLAIILPASTYPLQIVLAARFLEQLESDSSLEPDETWDESVIALLNYPEVIQMMNENIEWTWQLGDAVVIQEADVLTAIGSFRDLAYAAGNLNSDEYQEVSNDGDVIIITQVDEKIIYVPYYVPEEVIVYQTRPVYHYYPTAYPVYYYPYSSGHYFMSSFFWGVTTAFSIGWHDHHLRVYHLSYLRHPYYGHYYDSHHRYRRSNLSVFNSYYVDNSYRITRDRHRDGSYWRPQRNSGARPNYRRHRDRDYSRSNTGIALDGSRRDREFRGDRGGRGDREIRANRRSDNNPIVGTNRPARTALANDNPVSSTNRVRTDRGDRQVSRDVRNSRRAGADRPARTNRPDIAVRDNSSRSTQPSLQSSRRRGSAQTTSRSSGAIANARSNTTTTAVRNRPSAAVAQARIRSNVDRSIAAAQRRSGSAENRLGSRNGSSVDSGRSSRRESSSASRAPQPSRIAQLSQSNRTAATPTNRERSTVSRSQRTAPVESRIQRALQAESRQSVAPRRERSAAPVRRAESSTRRAEPTRRAAPARRAEPSRRAEPTRRAAPARSNRSSTQAASRRAPSSASQENSASRRGNRRNDR